jgi:hypothetical protein
MKEAAGEANLTVVAIILIAVVVAVATPLINSLMTSSTWKSCCTDAGGVVEGSKCMINGNDERANVVSGKSCNENFTG